ncbi:MAG: outer membrane beta-barrel protein [bacterium]|nr:outer membrane beta-barrel protein [bacterium]
MGKKIPLLLFLVLSILSEAQTVVVRGNMNDTSSKLPLPNVLLMAIRFNDSSLVNYSRSNAQGIFNPITLPLDTYLVILSHPKFNDKTYFLVPSPSDTAYNFKNVVLPPKSVLLNEIEIIARREKTYYKGDTLIFTADSFKTRPNATVEDLLKKLPGFKVDPSGKITVQGKEVDQVLVDGDEFFGTDPTIATRNLNATSIANVQVFDKKNESSEEGKNETLKVLNLQMKDDAKKGYFGKVSGASDFQKYYEGEALINKFKGNRKISLFGLVANTPKQGFGGNDAYKYGLTGEQGWSYDEGSGSWTNNNNRGTGIPQAIKSGFYFNDKIGKKTKINTDYTYNQNNLWQGSQSNTQYFLTDTSYTNTKIKSSNSRNESHSFNFRVVQKLDSLSELTVAPKLKYATTGNTSEQTDEFISQENVSTRKTEVFNDNKGTNADANLLFTLNRNFKKKDRNLKLNYQPVFSANSSTLQLKNHFLYFQNQLPESLVVQQRTQENTKSEQNASVVYTEPFTKKFRTELSYNYTWNKTNNNRTTNDYSGAAYDIYNPLLSNNFDNFRIINRAGTKLIYEVKKYKISVGTYVRNIQQENLNLTSGNKLTQNINNILPLASFNYKISQGSNFSADYSTSSQQPDMQQMQPVADNTDPNRISAGTPSLLPTFSNNGSINYYFYKGISDVHLYSGANFGNTLHQISFTTFYDSLGRAITKPLNVDGNYRGNVWLGGAFPVFKKFFKIDYNLNAGVSNNVSYVNFQKNITQNINLSPGLSFEKSVENFEVSLGGNYNYSIPKSSISVQTNQPYYTYSLEGDISMKLPHKFILSTDGKYTNNGNRSPGYNINYFIWNASFGRSFLKTENLILTLNGYDILNQNISNQRTISSNQISDTKTQIIKRFFLLKLLYKFNNQKTKIEDDDY